LAKFIILFDRRAIKIVPEINPTVTAKETITNLSIKVNPINPVKKRLVIRNASTMAGDSRPAKRNRAIE
jgi:hypothetical protein